MTFLQNNYVILLGVAWVVLLVIGAVLDGYRLEGRTVLPGGVPARVAIVVLSCALVPLMFL